MPTPSAAPDLSIILPFHNEATSIRELFAKLRPVLDSLGLSSEMICIDDGSTDNSFALLAREAETDARVRAVRFARNFGKEAALTCGLRQARGRAAILMDSDLQHPPEVIPELVAAWQNKKAKMVCAIRRSRDTDSASRKLFSKTFYALFRHIAEIQLPEGAGDFRLLDRDVVDAVNALPERTRFMKGLMTWVGFDYAQVTFDVTPRISGKTHWSFLSLLRFAIDGITSFSTFPLRIWTWCGISVSLLAFFYGLFLTLRTLIFGIDVPGYASLMVGMLFLGGVQLISLGVLGEYLGRVYTEVKGRPLYLIAEQKGFQD